MYYLKPDEQNRIIDIIDTSDPHVKIGNPVGLIEVDNVDVFTEPLLDEYLVPQYKWTGTEAVKRTDEEIAADREQQEEPMSVWDELDAAYQEGVDSL